MVLESPYCSGGGGGGAHECLGPRLKLSVTFQNQQSIPLSGFSLVNAIVGLKAPLLEA